MFKKIEIWILYLTIVFSIVFAVGFGALVRQELVGKVKAGWVSKVALTFAEIPMVIKSALQANLKIEDRFPALDGFDGTSNAGESYLLLSRYDGDLREGVVDLVDLRNFKVVHTWNPDIDAFNSMVDQVDEYKYLDRDLNNSRHMLYHPVISKKGNLIFHADTAPLRIIDQCSNLVSQISHDNFHHSIEIDSTGNIWTSTHLYPQSLSIERVGRNLVQEGGYFDDAVVMLSAEGELMYEKSISKLFIESGLESRLSMIGTDHEFQLDPIHINDVQPVNNDSEYWKKGDVFISLGHQSMIILFRPSTDEIIWKFDENIFHQHDVDIINDHQIAIFNNNRKYYYNNPYFLDGHNEVLIYDFKTKEASSYLKEALSREDVRTISEGRSEILPNGDLFIEETNYGRTLYFNSDGSLRWTHVNRAVNGDVYLVAWSRILYTPEDIEIVNSFLTNKGACID